MVRVKRNDSEQRRKLSTYILTAWRGTYSLVWPEARGLIQGNARNKQTYGSKSANFIYLEAMYSLRFNNQRTYIVFEVPYLQ